MSKALSCVEEFVVQSPHRVFTMQCERVAGNRVAPETAAQDPGTWEKQPDPPLTSGELDLSDWPAQSLLLCRASENGVSFTACGEDQV